jgi:hypothetical protein
MPSVDSIAADYVERAAALDPYFATWAVPLDQARR